MSFRKIETFNNVNFRSDFDLGVATDFRHIPTGETRIEPTLLTRGTVGLSKPVDVLHNETQKQYKVFSQNKSEISCPNVIGNETQKQDELFSCPNVIGKEIKIPLWQEGIDRFSNFVTDMEPNKLLLDIEEILKEFKQKTSSDTFSYLSFENNFLCKISMDEYMTCEMNIGIYTHENHKSLLDIQELSGEHLTFAQFLENFKDALRLRKIIETPIFTPEFMNTYGLDLEIGSQLFD